MTETTPSPATESVPVHLYLSRLIQDRPDLTNVEIARRMGYERPNVIAMMRTGTMKIPVHRVPEFARILEVDPYALLQRVLSEYDPGLWALLTQLMGQQLVTRNELALLTVLRAEMGNMDPDLVSDRAFIRELRLLVAQVADRQVGQTLPLQDKPHKRESKAIQLNQELEEMCRRQALERLDLRRRILDAGRP